MEMIDYRRIEKDMMIEMEWIMASTYGTSCEMGCDVEEWIGWGVCEVVFETNWE